MPQTIRERAALSRAFRDHGYQDRQAFLHPPRPRWVDTVVGHVITAALVGSLVIAFLGGRYAS